MISFSYEFTLNNKETMSSLEHFITNRKINGKKGKLL